MAGTTNTGAKLHRLADQIAELPGDGLAVLAKDVPQLVGTATMRISGRARGGRQKGPTRPACRCVSPRRRR
jgi:hypothetical protein